ncbi:hypothetical protein [Helicobacter sp. 16-1353]|uniref:hypothetical protein n=1 Tax=Helicobacter sp. 16-1353 TaxID=2004996 RepID=UPI0015EE8D04|nr:hypothetical protein [Helicobacter sp. 16-1353]
MAGNPCGNLDSRNLGWNPCRIYAEILARFLDSHLDSQLNPPSFLESCLDSS